MSRTELYDSDENTLFVFIKLMFFCCIFSVWNLPMFKGVAGSLVVRGAAGSLVVRAGSLVVRGRVV